MYCACKHSTDVPTVQSCCQKAAVSKWRKKYLEKVALRTPSLEEKK